MVLTAAAERNLSPCKLAYNMSGDARPHYVQIFAVVNLRRYLQAMPPKGISPDFVFNYIILTVGCFDGAAISP